MSAAAGVIGSLLAEFGPPSGRLPCRQDQPWDSEDRPLSACATFGRFEALRRWHPDWSTARIRREIHAEVLAAGPAGRPDEDGDA